MKNVLVITYYWPPAGGPGVQRTLKFVKYMKEFGWNPIVLCPESGDYPILDSSHEADTRNIKVYKQNFFEPHNLYKKLKGMKETEQITTTVLTDKSNSFIDKLSKWIRLNLFIPDARMGWIYSKNKFINRIFEENEIDLIYSSGPPHSAHLVARKWAKKKKCPYAVDLRDPWTDFVSYQENKRSFFATKLDKSLEEKVLTKAEKVIVISPSMKESYLKYKESDLIEVITNGFDEEDFENNTTEPVEFNWTYSGNLDKNRVPYPLLDAVSEFNKIHPNVIKLSFVGRQCPELHEYIKKLEIETSCEIEDYVSHKEAIKRVQSTFGLVLVIDNVPNNESFLTGKIFEYIGAKKRIIGIGPTKGDAAKVLNESSAGEMFSYNDSASILEYLKKSYKDFCEKTVFENQSEMYTRKRLTEKLCKVFNDII